MSEKSFTVVGLGELIWDLYPSGKQLGGAPTNFAYVARLLGESSHVASRVGRDELGREALERLARAGVSTRHIQPDDEHPTGTVGVRIDVHGEADFNVNQNSAWDYLEWTDDWEGLAARTEAVCFGTLGQRHAQARETVIRFLRATRPRALRVFDVNLRHSFFDAAMLSDSLSLSNVVKLNSEELPRMAALLGFAGGDDEVSAARSLVRAFGLELVAITRGARGSLLVTDDETAEHPGFHVSVVDTVGAGDAFAAALVHKLLRSATLEETSEAANRVGAWVAARAGATPEAAPGELCEIVNNVGSRASADESG